MKKELQAFANSTANIFSEFKVNFYSSVIRKSVSLLLEKREAKPIAIKLNVDNNLYVVPQGKTIIFIEKVTRFLWPTESIFSRRQTRLLQECSYKN
jgi:hypothetical protein